MQAEPERIVWRQRQAPVECAICLSDTKRVFRTPCGHEFHVPCLRRALRHKAACPLCRAPLQLPQPSDDERQLDNAVSDVAAEVLRTIVHMRQLELELQERLPVLV